MLLHRGFQAILSRVGDPSLSGVGQNLAPIKIKTLKVPSWQILWMADQKRQPQARGFEPFSCHDCTKPSTNPWIWKAASGQRTTFPNRELGRLRDWQRPVLLGCASTHKICCRNPRNISVTRICRCNLGTYLNQPKLYRKTDGYRWKKGGYMERDKDRDRDRPADRFIHRPTGRDKGRDRTLD